MANVRVEAAAVTVQTTAAGTSPSLAEAASEPTTLALAATCPFIRSVLASQDPQAISNTLAPFMALANTTNATGTFAYRARGMAPASRRPPASTAAESAQPAEGAPSSGKDIVGDDWVMTDLSGADAPVAQTAPASAEVPLLDTTDATEAEGITASATPIATSAPAGDAAAAVPAEAGPSAPLAPAGRKILVQEPGQTKLEAVGVPFSPAAADQPAEAEPDLPKEAPADGEAALGATEPKEAADPPAGSPSKA